MKPILCNTFIPCFKGATVNLNVFSDTHGELRYANNALECMRDNDVFEKEEKGKANILAIVGDWFCDGGRKGLLSAPGKNMQDFQKDMLNRFISEIKNIAGNTKTLFVPGNHEFDAGVMAADKAFSQIDAEILITNSDIEHSEGLAHTKASGNPVNQKIIEVEDDKNPQLKHKVLFLGIMPVNLQYYQKDSKSISMPDNLFKLQAGIKREDYEETIAICKKRISEFKKDNPKGAVVLLCHTGVNFADNLAKESSVDLIFDGHEHKNKLRTSNNVPIMPLAKNFEKTVNAKMIFDDNGNLSDIKFKELNPLTCKKQGILSEVYNNMFKKDSVPVYSINSVDKSLNELSVDGVRCGNNFLANFVTDSILSEIKKHNPEVNFFALNSSSIRHSLPLSDEKCVSNFDMVNVLVGITSNDGQLYKTKVKGSELAYLVCDNLVFNSVNPEKNTIMQYSGLEIDRTSILNEVAKLADKNDIESPEFKKLITGYIIDKSTGKPVEADKDYVIANTFKYFNKTNNESIADLKNISSPLNYGVHELFNEHFVKSGGKLSFAPDVRIY